MQVDAHSDFIQNWYVWVYSSNSVYAKYLCTYYGSFGRYDQLCSIVRIFFIAVLIMYVYTICGRDVEVASRWGSTNNEYAVLSTIPPGLCY